MEFPNVHLLVAVWVHLDTVWHFDALFKRTPSVHVVNELLVREKEVGWLGTRPFLEALGEVNVLAVGVGFALLSLDEFFFVVVLLFHSLTSWCSLGVLLRSNCL